MQKRFAAVRRTHQVVAMFIFHIFHLSSPSPASKQIRHLRQSISITGLGLDEFQDQVKAIPELAAIFTRAVSEDKIQPNAIIGDIEDMATLSASNRYFTPRKHVEGAKELTFPQDVDPYGNLTRLLGTAHVHIDENVVSYFERVTSTPAGRTK